MKGRILKKIIPVVLLLVILLVNVKSLAYAEENKQGVDVILIIDTSGSMNDRDPEKHALNMADFFVRSLPDDNMRLGVYNYSTHVNDVFPFREILSQKSDKAKIHNELKKLDYDGDTDMGAAFAKCAEIWDGIKNDSASRKQIIVFLTDGEISFLDDSSETAKTLIEESRTRMNEALDRIDCTACPVYVIAFGDDAVEGEDAKSIALREGNRLIPAREKLTLNEAYNNVFENLLGTKKVETTGITINKDKSKVALDNDSTQTGLNINITQNEKGDGSVLDNTITIVNDDTGKEWTKDDFEDYSDEYLGRLLKIPEEILKSGHLSLKFDIASTESDIVDIKKNFIYNALCSWKTGDGTSYEQGEEITFKISVDGIDTNSFVVYAVFEKEGKEYKQIIPDKVYSGDQVKDVKIYGSSLDPDQLEKFSGIKMLLDTQDNTYQTKVSFDKPGNYRVHIYGESEKGFTQSETLSFSITKSTEPGWVDILISFLHKLWEMFLALPIWGKGIVFIFIAFIFYKIFSFVLYQKEGKDDEDDEDDEDE